jgi:biotin transport system substrate-specific component
MNTTTTLVHTLAGRADSVPVGRAISVASVLFVAALTAAAAQVSVPLPFTAVPLTFQPMIVLLGGLALGSKLGLASQVVYLAAGLAGLPVFAASATLPPGPLRLLGPTGGYLMAYPVAAFVVGYLAERGLSRRYVTSVIAMLAGLAIVYACGATWLAFFARLGTQTAAVGVPAALMTGVAPFVLADLVKLLAAAGILPSLWRLTGERLSSG